MRVCATLLSLALLAASAPSLGQTPCQLPPDPKAVGDLATNPTLAVYPQWNGVSVGMIPSAQPITLHLIFPITFDKTTPTFKIAGKLADDAWLDFPIKDWQPANDNRSGDLVLEPVPDNRLSPVPFTQLHLVVVACASDKQLVGRTDALISLRWLSFVGAFAITALFYVLGAL
jgi:hypothetical protein